MLFYFHNKKIYFDNWSSATDVYSISAFNFVSVAYRTYLNHNEDDEHSFPIIYMVSSGIQDDV